MTGKQDKTVNRFPKQEEDYPDCKRGILGFKDTPWSVKDEDSLGHYDVVGGFP